MRTDFSKTDFFRTKCIEDKLQDEMVTGRNNQDEMKVNEIACLLLQANLQTASPLTSTL